MDFNSLLTLTYWCGAVAVVSLTTLLVLWCLIWIQEFIHEFILDIRQKR